MLAASRVDPLLAAIGAANGSPAYSAMKSVSTSAQCFEKPRISRSSPMTTFRRQPVTGRRLACRASASACALMIAAVIASQSSGGS